MLILYALVEHYLQTYTEPVTTNPLNVTTSTSTGSVPSTPNTTTSTNFPTATASATAPLVTTTTSADQVTLPLSQGTLTNNLGIPIIVVCTKVRSNNGSKRRFLTISS